LRRGEPGDNMLTMGTPTIDPGKARVKMLRTLRNMTMGTGRVPSLGELASWLRISIPGAKKQLDWLAEKGLISKVKGQPRSAVLTESGRLALKNRRAVRKG